MFAERVHPCQRGSHPGRIPEARDAGHRGTQRCVRAGWAARRHGRAGGLGGGLPLQARKEVAIIPPLNAPSVWKPHFHLITGMNRANYRPPGRPATQEQECTVRGLRCSFHPSTLAWRWWAPLILQPKWTEMGTWKDPPPARLWDPLWRRGIVHSHSLPAEGSQVQQVGQHLGCRSVPALSHPVPGTHCMVRGGCPAQAHGWAPASPVTMSEPVLRTQT
jgi:hypothetical protein